MERGKTTPSTKPKSPEPRKGVMGTLDAIEEEVDDAKRAETAALNIKRLSVVGGATKPEK